MLLKLIINKKHFKCYWELDWQIMYFHVFIYHLCFGITISDFGKAFNFNSYWQGFAIGLDWLPEWIEGNFYKYFYQATFQQILTWELYQDKKLKLGMSGIL